MLIWAANAFYCTAKTVHRNYTYSSILRLSLIVSHLVGTAMQHDHTAESLQTLQSLQGRSSMSLMISLLWAFVARSCHACNMHMCTSSGICLWSVTQYDADVHKFG